MFSYCHKIIMNAIARDQLCHLRLLAEASTVARGPGLCTCVGGWAVGRWEAGGGSREGFLCTNNEQLSWGGKFRAVAVHSSRPSLTEQAAGPAALCPAARSQRSPLWPTARPGPARLLPPALGVWIRGVGRAPRQGGQEEEPVVRRRGAREGPFRWSVGPSVCPSVACDGEFGCGVVLRKTTPLLFDCVAS